MAVTCGSAYVALAKAPTRHSRPPTVLRVLDPVFVDGDWMDVLLLADVNMCLPVIPAVCVIISPF
jgi:hypothetical protein